MARYHLQKIIKLDEFQTMVFPHLHELIDTVGLSRHLENTPFGIILWDEQMRMVYCSKRAADVFGCAPEVVLHKKVGLLNFVYEEDAPTVANLIADLTSGRSSHNESTNRNISKEGNIIYCEWYNSALKDDNGKVINILSLFQDVTAQVKIELALKKSQQQLSLAFNSAIDPMWLIRIEGYNQFRFETINLAFTKVTGWTPEQVEGQPMEKIIPEPSHDLVREKYNEAINTGKIIDYVEESLHPSGVKYAEVRVIPIHNEGGKTLRILGIANDITERVYLQKKLDAEREMRSRHITSAAIKGQESERAKVSRELHDNVNQMLTTVKLYIELCIDQKVDEASVLPKCAAYLNNTITEIRNLSKQLSAPSLGGMNFKETLTDLIESVRAAGQIDIAFQIEDISCQEMENELHLTLYRIAQEQFTNIIKYAKANRIYVLLKIEESNLVFTIADDGKGFDANKKREGIGITNMQSRVEILNGHFEILSTPGKGTKLEVRIPIHIVGDVCHAEQPVLNSIAG